MYQIITAIWILAVSFIPLQTHAQSYPCQGTGCCCNRQVGGNWPDCVKGYECRGTTTAPYYSVCVLSGAPPQTALFIASNQPAKCIKKEEQEELEERKDSSSKNCHGEGCCCNLQAGGNWPDCDKGYECRAMPQTHIQVCIKNGSPPQKLLFLASSQPSKCIKKESKKSVKNKDKIDRKFKSCKGEGCCCQDQPLGRWPDCDIGYECRQATNKPYFKVCIKKGAPANKPLFIATGQPANCFQKYRSGRSGKPGAGHFFCESQPNAAARDWCRRHLINPPNMPKRP
jgi:hypothetical protein